jgi:hypothetical protein
MTRNVTGRSGSDGSPDFRPPRGPVDEKRGVRTRTALVVLAVLVLAAAGLTVYHFTTHRAPAHTSSVVFCPGSTPRFEVFRNHGACVGVTDGSYVFSPALGPIEHAIAQENAKVVRLKHYVTVALLTPMTSSVTSAVSLTRIEHELAGAYAGQLAANGTDPAQAQPAVQIVMANEGTSQESAYGQVTALLKKMKKAPVNLRAVIGMGVSVAPTIAGAQALGNAGIPMIGSVITADQLDAANIKGLSRVVPDVAEEITTLKQYFQAHGGMGPAFLVADSDTNDFYTLDLKNDLIAAFGRDINSEAPYGPQTNLSTVFRIISDNICPAGAGTPPTVFYAGREAALPQFIKDLELAPNCGNKAVTVVTGADATGMDPSVTLNQPREGHVTVICTDIENPNVSAVTGDVRQIFAGIPGGPASLADSWTIATYNAMTAASVAISDAAIGAPGGIPTLSSVWNIIPNLNHASQVEGATGPFSIGPDGNVINPVIPVLEISNGTEHQLQ